MSSVTLKPSDSAARRDAVEDQVLAAVEQLLDDGHSFVELSVATIARAAGVARSTFYVHFADKTELLIRLASSTTADIFEAAHEWVDTAVITEPSEPVSAGQLRAARESLDATCHRIVADYRSRRVVLAAVQAATGYDPAVADYWFHRIDAFVQHTTPRLVVAQKLGLVDPDVNVETLARMAAWSIERTVSQTVAHTGAASDHELAATLARGLWLMTFGSEPRPPAG